LLDSLKSILRHLSNLFVLRPEPRVDSFAPNSDYTIPTSKKLTMIQISLLKELLEKFVSSTPDLQGVALVTLDGLPLTSVLPSNFDEERTAAMSAAMLSLGERIGQELARGAVDRIMVEGETGYSILNSCGGEAMLIVLASREAKKGLTFLFIKRLLAEIKPLLGA
jgi:predicted regulator of Ras-like GTPase activity (Roadblock/LC7/MglB family)